MRSALEERIGVKLGVDDAIWPWIVEYASYLLNRMEVSHDGKTSYERNKGKKARVLGIEFGEAVLWKRRPVGGALGKLAVMWEDGVFIGVKGTTNEVIIGAGSGVHRTRTIQRKPFDERWSADLIKRVSGVPWRKSDDDPEADGEAMKSRPLSEEEKRIIEERNQAQKELQEAPKGFSIALSDAQKHGVTPGCNGCKSIFTGRARQPHTRGCRARFEDLLKSEGKVKAARKRADDYFEKVTGADEEKRRSEKKNEKEGVGGLPKEGVGGLPEERVGGLPKDRKMTREEVREDLQKLKKARVASPTEAAGDRRSRKMSPEERMRIRNLPSSAAATM
jgi:hypothetical protein